jgi:hypothetical protein
MRPTWDRVTLASLRHGQKSKIHVCEQAPRCLPLNPFLLVCSKIHVCEQAPRCLPLNHFLLVGGRLWNTLRIWHPLALLQSLALSHSQAPLQRLALLRGLAQLLLSLFRLGGSRMTHSILLRMLNRLRRLYLQAGSRVWAIQRLLILSTQ